ncbi:hypothetical protein [Arenibaculum pallidiluteum]|uniref:hypothetical protein n=1 Tax=Arenibaculum pallidiluteum TaxID=2812559 RepID=UPI001A978B74|nr:hypothetical protein [Arenibaculum pallidiluteum]
MNRRLLLLALLPAALAACGKRPGALRAPEGSDPVRFPAPYPNPKYDRPQPPEAPQARNTPAPTAQAPNTQASPAANSQAPIR